VPTLEEIAIIELAEPQVSTHPDQQRVDALLARLQNLDESVQPPAVTPSSHNRVHALSTRYQELDGLRGMAAVVVITLHYLSGPAVYSHTVHRILDLIVLSPVTVDMFFILSGFLVGGILLNTRNSDNYYKTFYMRRLFRVMPLYYLWIFTFLLIAFVTPGAKGLLVPPGFTIAGFAAEFAEFRQNLWRFPEWGAKAPWFNTTWSLAIEEHFYLVAPLCLLRLGRRSLLAGLSAVILLSPIGRATAAHFFHLGDPWGVTYTSTIYRADALAMGVLLAVLWDTPKYKNWICERVKWVYYGFFLLAPITIGIGSMSIKQIPHTGSFAIGFGRSSVEAWSLCVILIALINQGKENVAYMRWRWLRQLGKISYCAYLIHCGVLWIVLNFGFHTVAGAGWRTDIPAVAISFILTFAISTLSWNYFEAPLQRLGHSFTY
jgi:peptidoglycan/LPS O-acetylase OafA/YrhL